MTTFCSVWQRNNGYMQIGYGQRDRLIIMGDCSRDDANDVEVRVYVYVCAQRYV